MTSIADETGNAAQVRSETTPGASDGRDGTGAGPMAGSRAARPGRVAAASAGLLAGAAALGFGELVGGLRSSWQSPVVGVAEAVIDRVPRPVKDFAIDTFGTSDKVALVVGILVVSTLFAAGLGLLSRSRRALGVVGFAGFAGLGAWASQQAAGAPASAVLPSFAAGGAGVGALLWLLGRRTSAPAGSPSGSGTDVTGTARRQFLVASGATAVLAAVFGLTGRTLRGRFSASGSRAALDLPTAASPLPPAPPSVAADVPGVSPFFTPNADFYRIDTALDVPQVAAEDWTLRIHGLVDREVTFTYADLIDRGVVEQDITLTCVSNTVGGQLLGTARWLGVPLADLLAEAGVAPAADQLVGRSVDGYTCGFPLSSLDGRPALVAIGMNGEPLPLEHGFPARLIVSGLYGYVSATKWLSELEITTFDAFDQYWVRRGWDERAPIKTMARIDTPKTLGSVAPGTVAVGGVAWAQTRGISRVEISIDDAEFVDATLADELNVHTWRQWSYAWEGATPGRHRITVRATDGDGELQTPDRADPFPNGASGWMSILVDVEEGA